jgi:hypothetical protein
MHRGDLLDPRPTLLLFWLVSMYKEAPPLATPLGTIATFDKEGNKHVTKRISSALALIFVFSLGQFALALNTNARTIAATTAFAQENQNRREDRRDRNEGRRRRHRRHRRHAMQRQDRRDNRNSNRPPS